MHKLFVNSGSARHVMTFDEQLTSSSRAVHDEFISRLVDVVHEPGSNFYSTPLYSFRTTQHFILVDRDDGFTHLGYEVEGGSQLESNVKRFPHEGALFLEVRG